jgi:hypothetical protein
MSAGKQYVLDANVFINAHRTYYDHAFCRGFWLALVRQHEARRVCSINKIKAELLAGRDWLSDWVVNSAPSTFFKAPADKKGINAFQRIANWVQRDQQFTSAAKSQFASVADGWLVAYAEPNGLVVVTHEEYTPTSRRGVPIPNLCLEFNVDYCNTFAMLRDLKIELVLRKHGKTS